MNTAILFSGGKDSTMALYWCLQNAYTVKYLVSAFPANPDSMLFHTSNIELVRLIAEAIGIELIEVPITSQDDKGETEELKKALKNIGAKGRRGDGAMNQEPLATSHKPQA